MLRLSAPAALVHYRPLLASAAGRCRSPASFRATAGLHHDKCRRPLSAAGIVTEMGPTWRAYGSGLRKTRWVVERTISWLHDFRRLRIRFERLAFIHDACYIICWRTEVLVLTTPVTVNSLHDLTRRDPW